MTEPFRYECPDGIKHNAEAKCNTAWQQTIANTRDQYPKKSFSEVLKIASAAYRRDNPNVKSLTPQQKADRKERAAATKQYRKQAADRGWIGPGMRVTNAMKDAIDGIIPANPNWEIRNVVEVPKKNNVGRVAPGSFIADAPILTHVPSRAPRAPRAPNLRIEPVPFVPARPPQGSGYGPVPKPVSRYRPTHYPRFSY